MTSRVLITLAALSLSACKLCASQAPQPPADVVFGVAMHAGTGTLVLVGGRAATADRAQTWLWDGTAWSAYTGAGPSPRDQPLMVYDEARKRIILHGGERSGLPSLTDTWEWDGAGWREASRVGPPPRVSAKAAYDVARQRMVIFGGSPTPGAPGHDETWEWDGAAWTRVAMTGTRPPGRFLHAMGYDAARSRIVVFGGATFVGDRDRPFGDTWEWDGSTWREVPLTGPSARDHVAMTYSPVLRALVLHSGGDAARNLQADTWSYDGHAWTRISSTGPPRVHHSLAFDERSDAMIVYGGWGVINSQMQRTNELWILRAGSWSRFTPH